MRKWSLYVLAFGTFGLEMAEFGMMSILSVAAACLQVSVPEAGHFISAYALGVCFGAIMLTFFGARTFVKIAADCPDADYVFRQYAGGCGA